MPIEAVPALGPLTLIELLYWPGPGVKDVWDLYLDPKPAFPFALKVEASFKYPPGPGSSAACFL